MTHLELCKQSAEAYLAKQNDESIAIQFAVIIKKGKPGNWLDFEDNTKSSWAMDSFYYRIKPKEEIEDTRWGVVPGEITNCWYIDKKENAGDEYFPFSKPLSDQIDKEIEEMG